VNAEQRFCLLTKLRNRRFCYADATVTLEARSAFCNLSSTWFTTMWSRRWRLFRVFKSFIVFSRWHNIDARVNI